MCRRFEKLQKLLIYNLTRLMYKYFKTISAKKFMKKTKFRYGTQLKQVKNIISDLAKKSFHWLNFGGNSVHANMVSKIFVRI
ncbi:hypothetical protein BLA29_000106 [Euroglyphus maynei]|uniref:Uncharacterized protein n=1 Tax=Euroglyphus maynei TaxID=6958 RepID=A0A1Y3B474_EURMA|nr:hypothetical protein BLA29_000106 [Euroglyphus maynei]